VIGLNSDINDLFSAFVKNALYEGKLSDRDKAIVQLALSYAFEDIEGLREAIVDAKQLGITNQEIGHICALVIVSRGQRIANLGQVSYSFGWKESSQSSCCK